MSKTHYFYLTYILVITSLWIGGFASATTEYAVAFNKTYGGVDFEYSSFAVETLDGGFFIVGNTRSYGAGDQDIWLLKIDSGGNAEWNKTYGTPAFESSFYIIRTDNDDYLISARSIFGEEEDTDLLLIMVDQNGEVLWNRTMGGNRDERIWEIEQTSDGGYALAGITNSYGLEDNDYWLLKIDSEGNPLWNRTYGGVDDDRARSLLITDDGGFLLNGWSSSYGAGMIDFLLVKTDSIGNHVWNNTFGGPDNERGGALLKSSDEGYVLAGSTASYSAGANDFYLVKTDQDGEMLWNKSYGGKLAETALYLLSTVDGGYVLTGYTTSYGAGDRDLFMVFTDSMGNMLRNQTFGGKDYEGIGFAIMTANGGYLIGGHTRSYGAGDDDYIVIKLDPVIKQQPEPEPEPTPTPPEPEEEKQSGGIPGFPVPAILISVMIIISLSRKNNIL